MTAVASPDVSTGMTIGPLRWWQLEDVLAIEQRCFPSDPWTREQLWSELGADHRWYAVACDEASGTIIGYAGAFVLPPDADVQTIAVDASARGRGVGAAMLAALLRAVAERGASQCFLEVREGNAAAISLYERAGFAHLRRRPNYYPDGEAALVMRAVLGRATLRARAETWGA